MLLQAQSIVLRARHIPAMFEPVSRSLIQTKSAEMTGWSLLSEIVTRGLELRQRTCLSQSATPQFMSPILEPLALEVDALSHG